MFSHRRDTLYLMLHVVCQLIVSYLVRHSLNQWDQKQKCRQTDGQTDSRRWHKMIVCYDRPCNMTFFCSPYALYARNLIEALLQLSYPVNPLFPPAVPESRLLQLTMCLLLGCLRYPCMGIFFFLMKSMIFFSWLFTCSESLFPCYCSSSLMHNTFQKLAFPLGEIHAIARVL